MFAKQLVIGLFLIGSLGFFANGLPQALLSARSEIEQTGGDPAMLVPRHEADTSVEADASLQVSLFITSWTTLSQSFTDCHRALSQTSSITVVIQLVATLHASVQVVKDRYESCRACSSHLEPHGAKVQIKAAITVMIQSFQGMVSTCKKNYPGKWDSQLASVFVGLQIFVDLSTKVCTSAGIVFQDLLSEIEAEISLFLDLGINLGHGIGLSVGSVPEGRGLIGN